MKITDERFLRALRCPNCRNSNVALHGGGIICKDCGSHSLSRERQKYNHEINQPINRIKSFFKKSPRLVQFIHLAVGGTSFFGQSPLQTLKKLYKDQNLGDKIIVNVGSGTKRVSPEVINLDIFQFKEVDIVADAVCLPFKDSAVDMIISESTLEHIADVEAAIREIIRVVKPGGFVYISIPFMMPFHASPNDYIRLTDEGLRQKFFSFKPIKIGMIGGPASALVEFLMHFLALPFSAVSETMYNLFTYFFMVILSPLRVFDLVFYLFPRSIEVSSVIYFIGKK